MECDDYRVSIRIDGPSLGPVHTTVWSSGSRGHSRPWALLLVLPVAALAWNALTYTWVDVTLAILAVLGVFGWLSERVQRKPAP